MDRNNRAEHSASGQEKKKQQDRGAVRTSDRIDKKQVQAKRHLGADQPHCALPKLLTNDCRRMPDVSSFNLRFYFHPESEKDVTLM